MNKKLLKRVMFIWLLFPLVIYWLATYFSLDNPFEEMVYSEIHTIKLMNFTSLHDVIHSQSFFEPGEDDFKTLNFEKPNILKESESIRIFISDIKQLSFWYKQKLDDSTTLHIDYRYEAKSKMLFVEYALSVNVRTDKETSYHGKELLTELKKYGKDKTWLKKEEQRILNKIILKTWFQNGSSRYSLEHLGNVQIREDKSLVD